VVDEGQPAPDFELQTDEGETVRLSDLRGKPVVLYFYPRDDTPGCTKQACGIRDAWGQLHATGAQIFGVSVDTGAAHKKFRAKYQLPFTLLADPDRTLADAYGVGREGKQTYARSTFVIDADGNVAKVMRNVKPERHADQLLAALA
jgi:thioredoxin-dependent peroxiredoxin